VLFRIPIFAATTAFRSLVTGMKRREFITLLGGAAAAWPLAARAQQLKVPIIGILSSFGQTQSVQTIGAILRGLSENGYVEGKSATIEYRFADGQYDRLPGLATELVHRPVDLIITAGPPAGLAAKAATTRIPVVFVMGIDPVAAGIVASINQPGGNVTGIMLDNSVLTQKRLEILLKFVPSATTVALLANLTGPDAAPEINAMKEMAQQRGLQFQVLSASTLSEIDAAFHAVAEKRPQALVVGGDPFYLSRPNEVATLVASLGIPAIYAFSEFAKAGGLVSYGTNRPVSYYQAGVYASRVLKGTNTADLPVMQPATFEFVINLKTAKTLGLSVPPTLLALADDVIE
jgi:putative tryptophan/tyrosine transport system substrate-binding protein